MSDPRDTVAAALEERGWKEYPDSLYPGTRRLLQGPRVSGPRCECNARPPPLSAYLWDHGDAVPRAARYRVEFEVVGERGGRWLHATVSSVAIGAAVGEAGAAMLLAEAVWRAYCDAARESADAGGDEP